MNMDLLSGCRKESPIYISQPGNNSEYIKSFVGWAGTLTSYWSSFEQSPPPSQKYPEFDRLSSVRFDHITLGGVRWVSQMISALTFPKTKQQKREKYKFFQNSRFFLNLRWTEIVAVFMLWERNPNLGLLWRCKKGDFLYFCGHVSLIQYLVVVRLCLIYFRNPGTEFFLFYSLE